MTKIKYLKDSENNIVYPVTHEKSVKDSSGVTLDTKLTNINAAISGLDAKTYIVAWDGASTPTASSIPSGIVVTYDGTSYTGTLTASASTIGKIYLVSGGTGYGRYVTSVSGTTYSWVFLGDTELELADYTKKVDFDKHDAFAEPVISSAYRAVDVDPTSLELRNFYILSTGLYNTSVNYKHALTPVVPGDIVTVVANSEKTTSVTFLKSDVAATSGGTPDYSSEWASIHYVGLGLNQSKTFVVPSDAHFLYTYMGYSGTSYGAVPASITIYKPEEYFKKKESLTAESVEAPYRYLDYSILSTGYFGTSASSSYRHACINVLPKEVYLIKNSGTTTSYTRYAFATANTFESGGAIPLVPNTTVKDVNPGDTDVVTIPEGCTHLLVNISGDNSSNYKYDVQRVGRDHLGDVLDLLLRRVVREYYAIPAAADTTFNSPLFEKRVIDIQNLPLRTYNLGKDAKTSANSNHKHCIIYVEPGEIVHFRSGEFSARVNFMYYINAFSTGSTVPENYGFYPAPNTDYLIKVPGDAVGFGFNAFISADGEIVDSRPTVLEVFHSKVDLLEKEAQLQLTGFTHAPIIPSHYYVYNSGEMIRNTAIPNGLMVKIRQGYRYHIPFIKGDSKGIYVAVISDIPYIGQSYVDSQYYSMTPAGGTYTYTATADGYIMFSPASSGALTITDAYEVKIDKTTETRGLPTMLIPGGSGEVSSLFCSNYSFEEIPVSSLTRISGGFNYTWGVYAYPNSKHVVVPVTVGEYVKIKAADSYSTFCFVKSDTFVEDAPVDFVEKTGPMRVSAGREEVIKVPEGAVYLYVYLGGSSSNYVFTPAYIGKATAVAAGGGGTVDGASEQLQTIRHRITSRSLAMGLTPLTHNTDADGWETVNTVQQQNSIKKAMQMCKIKWTPLATLPGKPSTNPTTSEKSDAHPQGVEQTGIPYSGNWHNYKYVGIEVSLHTFMTAVHNPYSLIYTEDIHRSASRSAWGNVYYNTNGWMYYGTVCCGLTAAVNGQPTKYGNGFIPKNARESGMFVPIVDDRNLNNLKIGDVYDNAAHSFLVYGLHRDANGDVDQVKIAESTGGVNSCRFVTYSKSSFITHINRSGDYFYGYRVPDLYKNIYYTPSKYVPLTEYGETQETVVYNDDICCFAGDMATFMEGDRVVINYNLTVSPSHSWTGIELYKDDVLQQTYTLANIDQSALPEGQVNHALDLGTTLTAGKYKARMTDGTNYSDYTYFEVLHNDITITDKADGSYEVKVNSAEPMMYVYCGQSVDGGEYFDGTPSGHYFFLNVAGREPDWTEAKDNKMILFFNKLISFYGGNPTTRHQIRVMLKGDYGMAATPPITLPGRVEEEGEDNS